MKVLLKTLGCRLNEAELEQWAGAFQEQGHQLTKESEQADLIVLNTCAVTQEAVKKSRQLIRRSQRANPKAKLVVSGCYTSLNPGLGNELEGIDLLVANRDKHRLVNIVNEELALKEAMPALATSPGEAALFSRGRNRAFIKVQDGCRYRCSFCIVTVARGQERSRSVQEIVNEINKIHASGIQEVILTGVHIGGYGSDIDSDLFSLLESVLEQTDIPRLRLGSVEPWDLGENFFTLFDNPRFMPHLHLPLQSGSDAILKAMGRRCKSKDFSELLAKARKQVADFNVTTDIIVGFPGETQQDWQTSLSFIEEMGFSHIHIFPYSPRAGTRAADFPNHVPAEVKKRRCAELHELASMMKSRFLTTQIGKRISVLFESKVSERGNQHGYSGYSPNYLRVQLANSKALPLQNTIREVEVSAMAANDSELIAALP